MKPLRTPNEKIKMDVAGSCVLYVSKYFHLLLKFPLGVAKKSYKIVNTMVNLDSFYGETFPHPLKSLVSICSVIDKPKVLLNLPFCPARGLSAGRAARWDRDGSAEAASTRGAGPASPLHPPGISVNNRNTLRENYGPSIAGFPSHHPVDLFCGLETPK